MHSKAAVWVILCPGSSKIQSLSCTLYLFGLKGEAYQRGMFRNGWLVSNSVSLAGE